MNDSVMDMLSDHEGQEAGGADAEPVLQTPVKRRRQQQQQQQQPGAASSCPAGQPGATAAGTEEDAAEPDISPPA